MEFNRQAISMDTDPRGRRETTRPQLKREGHNSLKHTQN